MGVIPCGHRVVVKLLSLKEIDKAYEVKIDGFEIVGEDIKRREEGVDIGEVVAIGPTAFRDFGGEAWCAVGDTVAFAKYAGKVVKDLTTDQRYQVLNDEDLVCILKKGE